MVKKSVDNKPEKVMSEVKVLTEQLATLDEKFKRVLADYQNQEKRNEANRSMVVKLANETLLDKILPVLDDLNRAQSHLQDKGLSQVIKTFEAVLASEGLTPIESDQADFDPLTMDCAEVVPGEKNKVVRTVSVGYRLFDKVLRPAKVEVGGGETPIK